MPVRWRRVCGAVLASLGVCVVGESQTAVTRLRFIGAATCTGTTITTSDTWQTLSAAAPNGTTFCIGAGTHRLQSVTPKQDQKFISVVGAIMSGARVLTGPTGTGPWAYSGQTQEGTQQGVCRATEPMCQHPEDVYIDDVRQHAVATLGEVTVGSATWFLNYATDTLYLGTNPSGHVVEATVTPASFVSEGGVVTGVEIRGLTIEKYASVGGKGMISAPNGQGWIVSNNVFRWNHSTAVGIGTNGQVVNNYLHHNGQSGIGAYDAVNLTVSGNEVAYNGELFDPFWGAGGIKLAYVRSSTMASNFSHHNRGPGLWCDIDCNLVTFSANTAEDNDQAGIFYEISFNGLITGNFVRRNGFNAGTGPAQAGIFIAESKGVEVTGNVVEDNAWAIYGYQEPRGTSALFPTVAWQIIDLNVHGNTVRSPSGGRVGLEQAEGDNSYFTSKNNTFESNTYSLQTNTNQFTWSNANGSSFATWQGFGHDTPVGAATTY